jgi:hypothetical protein
MYTRRFRFSTDQSAPPNTNETASTRIQMAAAATITVSTPLHGVGNRFLRIHSPGEVGCASGAISTAGSLSGVRVSSYPSSLAGRLIAYPAR